MLLRNYGTLIAIRKGKNVEITNTKYSKTTTIITNKVKNMALNNRMNVKYVDKFADGGGVGNQLFGNDNPDLVNFDLNELDPFEQMQYNHLSKSSSKAETLQVLINNVEGDYSQLSPRLSEIAEAQYPSDRFAGGGEADLDYNEIFNVLKSKIDDAIDDIPNKYESASQFTGEEVEHISRDGFIPYTDGGYEARWFETLGALYGSGYSLPTKPLTDEMNRQIDYNLKLAKDNFIENYPEIVEELGEENIDYFLFMKQVMVMKQKNYQMTKVIICRKIQ
jgi:hypothetical protein